MIQAPRFSFLSWHAQYVHFEMNCMLGWIKQRDLVKFTQKMVSVEFVGGVIIALM